MKAKKSLGQHFLKSEKALRQIIDAGDIHTDDIVLEIGPGHGVLTERLLKLAGKVIAIEKDRELIPLLQEKFEKEIQKGKLDIVEQDVLEFNPETLSFYNKHYKLIANIPYYITGAIIEQFLSTSYQPERMVLLMQKEVADRIVARDNKPFGGAQGKESILSIAVKAYGKPKIVGIVPPGAFTPAPTVDSAVLLIENISRDFFKDTDPSTSLRANESLFFTILKTCFGQKRKQLGHTLAHLYKKEEFLPLLKQIGISSKIRPEELSKEQWRVLSTTLSELAILKNDDTKTK